MGIFLVTVLTLNALVFKPLLQVMDLRQSKIEGTVTEARRMEKDAEARVNQYEAQIVAARRQGTERQKEIRDRAARRGEEIIAEGQTRATARLNESMPRIQATYQQSKAGLQVRSRELATMIADRVLEPPRRG
jgi:F-type H+-transporting ATPase subunit b